MSVSVALAAYNGEKYIKQQIDSILSQLNLDDELVVSLDNSTDNTSDILNQYAKADSRVKVFNNPSKGILNNFENAILNCNNDYIFLCDQDDIWLPNKVERVLEEFLKTKATVIMHNAKVVDENLNIISDSFFALRNTKIGFLKNIIKNSYIGCCMAFTSKMKDTILPFPKDLPMHDQWIGLLAEKTGSVSLIEEPLLLYRRHGDNVSSDTHSGILQMIKWRISLIKEL